ncbi:hypothetical protein ACFQU7_37665 [Pseudoroseomonas wenyumeiae]
MMPQAADQPQEFEMIWDAAARRSPWLRTAGMALSACWVVVDIKVCLWLVHDLTAMQSQVGVHGAYIDFIPLNKAG